MPSVTVQVSNFCTDGSAPLLLRIPVLQPNVNLSSISCVGMRRACMLGSSLALCVPSCGEEWRQDSTQFVPRRAICRWPINSRFGRFTPVYFGQMSEWVLKLVWPWWWQQKSRHLPGVDPGLPAQKSLYGRTTLDSSGSTVSRLRGGREVWGLNSRQWHRFVSSPQLWPVLGPT